MLKQNLQQKLLQKLTPQQIQLIKLVELPILELEQKIKQEIEDNPALEEIDNDDEQYQSDDNNSQDNDSDNNNDDEFSIEDYIDDDDDIPAYKMYVNNTSKDDKHTEYIQSSSISFLENLTNQFSLKNVTEREKFIGEFLIGNIDDAGYLRRELDAMVDDIAFLQNVTVTEEELQNVLSIIQELDPAGVGARTLKECLLLQLKRKENQNDDTILAKKILENNFEAFSNKHYSKIMAKLNIDEITLKSAIDIILKLNPKPGNAYSEQYASPSFTIIPDFILEINNGQIELSLNHRNVPDIKISKNFSDMLKDYSKHKDKQENKDAVKFIKQKLDAARWFIDAISERQNTLLVTMNTIVELQKNFFFTGDETELKPMILKNVADVSGLDVSTISRVANSKYVATPYGNYQLKYFFSEGLKTDSGEEVSTKEIKQILKDCISEENKSKPLTDDKLTEILKSKGYNIARRTIAKYREQLDIPVARLRIKL